MVAYRLKYFGPAIAYVVLIFFLSSLNQRLVSNLSWGLKDFILHGAEYHFLGVLLIWAILRDKPIHELRNSYRLAMGVGSFIAISDEVYQSFVPSRYSTIEDVVADVFGLILSIITFSLLLRWQRIAVFRTHA